MELDDLGTRRNQTLMKILQTLFIFLLTASFAFGGTSDWIRVRQNALQRIECRGASGKTDLVAATPTGSNVITLQDGTGTLAFMTDLGDSIFGPTGTLYADAGTPHCELWQSTPANGC